MKSRTRILAVLAVGACALTWARAEVSAETDAFKQYIRTVVLTTSSAKNTKIWTVQRVRGNYTPLNPAGDLNGDLWPVIAETPTIPRTPWVAWSRRTVLDFDIAWSRWDAATAAWTTVASVVVGPSVGNDLDPDIAFSADARPHLVWWSDAGIGRVFLSVFLSTRWMDPFLVSEEGVDSVMPAVTILADGRIQVDYETPSGHVTKIIVFHRPATITDDITPFGTMQVTETIKTESLAP